MSVSVLKPEVGPVIIRRMYLQKNQIEGKVPLDSFAVTSAVETLGTEISTTSLTSKDTLWSGADPMNGVAASLTPFVRWASCLEERRTIFIANEDSLVSSVEEEKMPVNLSPFLVVMIASRPYSCQRIESEKE